MDFCEIILTEKKLEVPPWPRDGRTGAVVDFVGIVRAEENGEPIDSIDYQAHPRMARNELEKVLFEAANQFSLQCVTLQHRVGRVAAGEASLFLRVCGKHRGVAYEASQWIVEELKRRVPIWKHFDRTRQPIVPP